NVLGSHADAQVYGARVELREERRVLGQRGPVNRVDIRRFAVKAGVRPVAETDTEVVVGDIPRSRAGRGLTEVQHPGVEGLLRYDEHRAWQAAGQEGRDRCIGRVELDNHSTAV